MNLNQWQLKQLIPRQEYSKNIKMLLNKIIEDWRNVAPCLKQSGKNAFYSKGPFFLYGFSLDLLRSKTEYRVIIKLINLASGIHPENKIDYTIGVINNNVNNLKGFYYNIPVNFHDQYFPDIKDRFIEQQPFSFCSNIKYKGLLAYLLTSIDNNKVAIVDFPILELEFLMQIIAYYNQKDKSPFLFKELNDKINALDKTRADYFMTDYTGWKNNLHRECEHPSLIIEKAEKKMLLIKNKSKLEEIKIISFE